MPNYRNYDTPYNHYRQTQMSTSMTGHDMHENKALAMAYVPWQTWRRIFEVEKALEHGTIFQELDKPFLGRGGAKR